MNNIFTTKMNHHWT